MNSPLCVRICAYRRPPAGLVETVVACISRWDFPTSTPS